jgi:predicted nucleotidyltransferase
MDQKNAGSMNLESKFSRKSDAKFKEGAFVGPQIRELIQDAKFEDRLSEVEKSSMEIIKKYQYQLFGKL